MHGLSPFPIGREPARRWLDMANATPDGQNLRLLSQPQSVTASSPVPNYTAWRRGTTCPESLCSPRPDRESKLRPLSQDPRLTRCATTPPFVRGKNKLVFLGRNAVDMSCLFIAGCVKTVSSSSRRARIGLTDGAVAQNIISQQRKMSRSLAKVTCSSFPACQVAGLVQPEVVESRTDAEKSAQTSGLQFVSL